jgi:hypothetical protein
MSASESELKNGTEKPPTLIIKAPPNYEQNHELSHCPLCNQPDPTLEMYLPVREFAYFDMALYTCETACLCLFEADINPLYDKPKIKPHRHKFSIKHDILLDASYLKVYDRTHQRGVW